MKLFFVAAFLAVAAAAPSSYKPEYKAPSYPAPSYPAPKYPTPSYPAPKYPTPSYPAPAYPAPAYPTPSYNKDNKYADITITSQSDERNLDGSSQWSYAQSDYTTREESQVQKKMQGVTYDSYGKESYGEVLGNTNKGSSYWILVFVPNVTSQRGHNPTLFKLSNPCGTLPSIVDLQLASDNYSLLRIQHSAVTVLAIQHRYYP
ncbi:Uncharacterized protein APZ42_029429 [Daphnia magna]|uniref:Cuticle protein n=1 Tax=Daphnia magna TaxID=35525 RepID=A0A164PK47_9CRUS|nr:Uncharacterized protein APZ42_029429 [Daphnia magna]